jgi:hypothetical protein
LKSSLLEHCALGFKSMWVEIHCSVEEATTTFHAHQTSVKQRAPAFPSVHSALLKQPSLRKSLPCFARARTRTKIQSRDESKDMKCTLHAAFSNQHSACTVGE